MKQYSIKSRNAALCNLKLFLIFCVILGHIIEPWIKEFDVLDWTYRFIYAFHMPLFVYVSGLLSPKTVQGGCKKAGRMFLIYLICQSFSVFLGRLTGQKITFIRPDWIYWYLLSLSFWYLLSAILTASGLLGRFTALPVLILFFAAALAAGLFREIGRDYSLSRTIVFAPYFFLGCLTPRSLSFKKYRIPAMICFAAGLVLIWLMKVRFHISASFFYQASWYGNLKLRGIVFRALSFLAAVFIGFPMLAFIPRKRFFFTALGSNTLLIYLFHGMIVRMIWGVLKSDFLGAISFLPVLSVPLSLWLLTLLGRFGRWHLPLYRVETEQFGWFR